MGRYNSYYHPPIVAERFRDSAHRREMMVRRRRISEGERNPWEGAGTKGTAVPLVKMEDDGRLAALIAEDSSVIIAPGLGCPEYPGEGSYKMGQRTTGNVMAAGLMGCGSGNRSPPASPVEAAVERNKYGADLMVTRLVRYVPPSTPVRKDGSLFSWTGKEYQLVSRINEILALFEGGPEVSIPQTGEDLPPYQRPGQVPGDLSSARLVVRAAVGICLLRVFRRLRQKIYENKSGDHRYAGEELSKRTDTCRSVRLYFFRSLPGVGLDVLMWVGTTGRPSARRAPSVIVIPSGMAKRNELHLLQTGTRIARRAFGLRLDSAQLFPVGEEKDGRGLLLEIAVLLTAEQEASLDVAETGDGGGILWQHQTSIIRDHPDAPKLAKRVRNAAEVF